tara:strand:+ start:2451 stop:3053 length:603 start_codon:yes stop_codon:yes gene_type:complete
MSTPLSAYSRPIYIDAVGVGGFAAAREYILTFTHLETGHSVSFPATIQNFSDTHTAEISEKVFADRMDPLVQQASTGRKISLSFKVLNASVEEARYNEQSINMLIQMMYPRLRDNGEVGIGSFISISGFNLLKDSSTKKSTKCLVSNINYSLNVDEGFITPNAEECHPVSITIDLSAEAILPKTSKDSPSPLSANYPSYR